MKEFKGHRPSGIHCYGKIEASGLMRRRVACLVYHYIQNNFGDVYEGNYRKVGIHKIGKFFEFDGKVLVELEEPEYYE